MDAKLIMELDQDASRAAELATKLQSKEALPRGTEAMPGSELHFCAGLAFTFVKKGGIGLGFEHGHGFVISKLPGDAAAAGPTGGAPSWTWSAPLFITVNAGSLGLTFGFSEIDSVVVLDTPEAVQAFTKTQIELDTDIGASAGSAAGVALPATAANFSNLNLSDKQFTYSVAKGAMVDVSLSGLGYTVDARKNSGVYGAEATPARILDGGVAPPPAMQTLYAALDKVLSDYYATQQAAVGATAEVTAEPVAEPVAP